MDEEKTTSTPTPIEESVIKILDLVSTTDELRIIGALIPATIIHYNHNHIIEKWRRKVQELSWPHDDSGVVEHLLNEKKTIEEGSSDLAKEILSLTG